METYEVTYSCGCVHEIKEEGGIHNPTGKQVPCRKHADGKAH